MTQKPIILVLRPQQYMGIVSAELKRVTAFGRYMNVEGTQRSEHIDPSLTDLRQLASLCEELTTDALYVRYANKKLYRHPADLWATTDKTVSQHIKRMADQQLLKAIVLADQQDIPILFAPVTNAPLHIEERLHLDKETTVKPVMSFCRHANGISYQLRLRLNDHLVEAPSEHDIKVLAYEPGIFIMEKQIRLLDEGFSGKLLLPFTQKTVVEIPQHMEDDYFRRFILRNVTKAEIDAKGFDIEDINHKPQICLYVNTSVDGQHVLTLLFRYDQVEYTPNSKTAGRVMLTTDEAGRFRFIRQLRNKALEQQAMGLLKKTGAKLTKYGDIRFSSLSAMVSWLQQHAPQLRRQGINVVQPSDQVYYIGPLSIEQSDTWQGDWLQTDVTIVLDDGRLRIPFRDLRDTILRGEQDYMLPTGERLFIPSEWLSRYENLLLLGRPKGKGFLRHKSQVAMADSQNSECTNGTLTVNKAHTTNEAQTLPNIKAVLRPYQVTGFQWLWHNFRNQTGCCLADEMGLGKTLQTIALLLKYKEMAKGTPRKQPQTGLLFTDEEMRGTIQSLTSAYSSSIPFLTSLVVAPASVVHNWHNELQRFAPSLLVMTYIGSLDKRHKKRQALMRWDVVLTTYRTLTNDIEYFAKEQFGLVVFDESQAFKTATSQVHHAVSRLNALHRMALSGTPVENNLHELWSLLSVLNPNLLGSERHFTKTFVTPIASQLMEERTMVLRQLIAPYFLKRTKEEVLSELPERQDEVVVCPMTEQQESHYAEELSKARNEYLVAKTSNHHSLQRDNLPNKEISNLHVLAAIQRLRQIANGEGKMKVVFERLEQLRGTRHKVLLFSEYVSLLEHVGNEMTKRGWDYDLLTGQTQRREQVIAHFQQTDACQFFLISLKAGGVGLNLTAADYVFILDPWWNLAAEEQAIARSHRIGQHYPVFVYRFVSEGTLEQQILTLQERKQNLIDAVMPFILK